MTSPYLDVRLAFAIAESDDVRANAIAEAHSLGRRDADGSSQPSMPLFFADEPDLAKAWKEGVLANEAEVETADTCSFCFKNHMLWNCPHL